MQRFEVRKQKHSRAWPYDGGWAMWDVERGEQYGWTSQRERAKADVAADNAAMERWPCPACNHAGNLMISWNKHGRCSRCDGARFIAGEP